MQSIHKNQYLKMAWMMTLLKQKNNHDVYAGQNQRYEDVEKDFDYDDGGEQCDWSSISINLPEGKDPKT